MKDIDLPLLRMGCPSRQDEASRSRCDKGFLYNRTLRDQTPACAVGWRLVFRNVDMTFRFVDKTKGFSAGMKLVLVQAMIIVWWLARKTDLSETLKLFHIPLR